MAPSSPANQDTTAILSATKSSRGDQLDEFMAWLARDGVHKLELKQELTFVLVCWGASTTDAELSAHESQQYIQFSPTKGGADEFLCKKCGSLHPHPVENIGCTKNAKTRFEARFKVDGWTGIFNALYRRGWKPTCSLKDNNGPRPKPSPEKLVRAARKAKKRAQREQRSTKSQSGLGGSMTQPDNTADFDHLVREVDSIKLVESNSQPVGESEAEAMNWVESNRVVPKKLSPALPSQERQTSERCSRPLSCEDKMET